MQNAINKMVLAAAEKIDPVTGAPGIDLTVASLFGIITGLACWASRFVLVFMVGAVIWYGFMFLISRGNPTAFASAKKNLTYGLVGIVVVLGAYTIISTVGNAVEAAGNVQDRSAWNNFVPISCSNY